MYKYDNLWNLFESCSNKYETKCYITYDFGLAVKSETFGETFEYTSKLINYLQKLSRGNETKAVFYIKTCQEWIKCFFACQALNITVIPIDIDSSSAMIEQIIEETKPEILFQSASKPLAFDKNFKFKNIINIDDLVHLTFKYSNKLPKLPKINQDHTAEIIYTSGTTGKPKGVVLSHKNLVYNLSNILDIFPVEDNISLLEVLPLSHLYAQMITFGITVIGGRINFIDEVNGAKIKEALNNRFINAMPAVPLLLSKIKDGVETKFLAYKAKSILDGMHSLARAVKFEPLKRIIFKPILKQLGGNLKIIIIGGASVPPFVYDWWDNMGVRLYKGYGATETGPVISFEDKNSRDAYSVGRPLEQQKCKIVDNEILAKGDHVFSGYFKNPEKTKEVFTEDGWYKTGDLGYMKNGKLYINGRKKDMIVLSNGLNVFPQDIEAELNQENNITDSCVIGLNLDGKEEKIWAILLTKESEKTIQNTIDKVNKRLNANQRISKFLIWPDEDFPRTHTKKIIVNNIKNRVSEMISSSELTHNLKLIKEKKQKEVIPSLKSILSEISKTRPEKITGTTKIVRELELDSLDRAEICAQIEKFYQKRVAESLITSETSYSDLQNLIKSLKISSTSNRIIRPSTIHTSTFWFWMRELVFNPLIRLCIFPFYDFRFVNSYSNISKYKQFLMIGNHRSRIDGFIFFFLPRKLRRKLVIVANEKFNYGMANRIRVFIMQLGVNVVVVDKNNGAMSTLTTVARYLNKGYSVFQFPEGRRLDLEKNQKVTFHKGPAKLVHDFSLPVIAFKIKGLENSGDRIYAGYRKKVDIEIKEKIFDEDMDVNSINKELEDMFN